MKKLLMALAVITTLGMTTTLALADDHSQDTVATTVTTYKQVVELNPGWDFVTYRTGAGLKYPVAGRLNKGETADFVENVNYWWTEISVDGTDYYISNPLTLQTTTTITTTESVEAPWKIEADQLIDIAKTQLGAPYYWGHQVPIGSVAPGEPYGFDCSNFVAWSYKQIGISFSGASQWQRYNLGTPVALSNIREGDVLFFATAGDPNGGGHVGIYMGDGYVIQCGGGWQKVTIECLATTWLGKNLVFARRVIN